MKRLFLVALLAASPAFANTDGAAHPLAPECAVTDTDCIAVHDGRVVTLATFMGVAAYCNASTTPGKCREAVAAEKAEQRLAAKAASTTSPSASASASATSERATYLDMSGPTAPEAEFPDVAKKGTL